jgi:hypothetical protein
MTDYLAVLKARVRQKHVPQQPSKPSEAPFEGFEGDGGKHFSEIDPTDLVEHAALVEFGTGVPRDWAEGFARLDLALPAPGFSEARWRLLIDDGGRFLDRWASDAAQLGWQAGDVFGIHPTAPTCRFDHMGLVSNIAGGEVVALNKRSATIRSPGGSHLVYLRRQTGGGICLWDLGRTDRAPDPEG